ncbi:MAG: MerR family transcriptional regulator [Rubrobacteraceae bacterium]|jgi:uncharacterized protein (DUF433 family)
MGARRGILIALGEGVYTVPEVARILQPTMNVYKVRYWLNKGLLGKPIRRGSRGRPHLLSFEQLLKVRTIQDFRETLKLPLQRVTPAIAKLSDIPFAGKDWHKLSFFRTEEGRIGVSDNGHTYEVETEQLVIPEAVLPELEDIARETRRDWARGVVDIRKYSRLVSNSKVVAGSPTIRETRLETSFIAYVVKREGVKRTLEMYPYLDREAVEQAAEFEGVPFAA